MQSTTVVTNDYDFITDRFTYTFEPDILTYPKGTIFTFSYRAINGEPGNERASLWSDPI